MSLKDILKKAGLVEEDVPSSPAPVPPAPVAGPLPPTPPKVVPTPAVSTAAPGAPAPEETEAILSSDFSALYRDAGIPSMDWGAEEALAFLAEIPVEESDAARRRSLLGCIRALSLRSPSLSPEAVAKDARVKAQALSRAIEERAAGQAKREAGAQREIDALRSEIQQRLKTIDSRKIKETELSQRLSEHAARLRKIEEFLSPGSASVSSS